MTAKFIVVHGAPLSGKTTYVKNRLGDNDIVYDFDELMQSLTGLKYQEVNENVIDYVTGIRDLIISKARSDKYIDNVYIITTYIDKQLKHVLKNKLVKYIQMEATKEECLERLHRSDRPNKADVASAILDYYW